MTAVEVQPIEIKNNGGHDKRIDIQWLRGVAIVYVLLFHLFPKFFPKGFLGVDIFFVISGYLITMILKRKAPISLNDTAIFFSKRVRRIFPTYYLTIFVVLLCGKIFLTTYDQQLLNTDSMWCIVFASNIHKYLQQRDYFAQIANYDFLLHTWSLAVEIQFYCLAPILIAPIGRIRFAKFLVILVGAASLAFHIRSDGELQFSSIPSRLWQFIAGAMAFEVYSQRNFIPESISKVVTCLSMGAVSPAILFFSGSDLFWRITVTTAAALIVARLSPSLNDFLFSGSIFLFIGDISYSLYLAHWPMILFLRYSLQVENLPNAYCVIAVEASILIAYVSFKTIEKYFIHENLTKSLIFIAVVCCSCITLQMDSSYSNEIMKMEPSKSESMMRSLFNETTAEKTHFVRNCFGFSKRDYRPKNVTPEMIHDAVAANKRFMHYWPIEVPLDSQPDPMVNKYFHSKNITITFTAYYKGPGKTSVAIFGNSYAHRAFFAVKSAFRDRFKEIRLLSEIGCPPFFGLTYPDVDCTSFIETSVQLLEEMKPDILFIIFRPFTEVISPITDLSNDEAFKNIQKTITRLSRTTKRIVLEYPLPLNQNRFYTPFLLERLEMKEPVFDEVAVDYSSFWSTTQYIVRRLDNIACENCDRIYPHKLFCDLNICRVFDPDNLYSFFDMGAHYNNYSMQCFEEVYADIINENYAKHIIE